MSPGAPDGRRPEKTDAVARRMIAGALGVKAPKQTEEQKAYDRAIKEQARKKKEEEREISDIAQYKRGVPKLIGA
ncbi:unnamed protein product [Parascedosporium putredinis]|uniref:Uncharacterized protein n=1 Tax=Parascedosporium putredinis TaxID=1442378 RepID=A0A9P1GW00_9PEZI|nr:unnamed protein product [Parascedosporium putredinis]CAI7988404.1 unnamed protein product [Parascedosporium putredinis]